MANAKNIIPDRHNTLLIGDSGTHKTWFLGTVPGVYIFDFDAGMTIVRGKDIEYDTFKDLPRVDDLGKPMPATPQDNEMGLYTYGYGWDAFYKKFLTIAGLVRIKSPKAPKAIAFDSLTMMSALAVDKILKDTNMAAPHQGTWGAHHEYFKQIFSMATAMRIPFYSACHIHRDENELTHVTEKLPLLTGKLAGLISTFFDEVYFMESVEDSQGKQSFHFITQANPSLRQAKSRWGVPNKTPADFATLSNFIK